MTTANFSVVLFLLALVLFLVDAFLVPPMARPRLQSLGLAAATLGFIIRGF
jgi:hypothetical protein